jgi:hypothetical protein
VEHKKWMLIFIAVIITLSWLNFLDEYGDRYTTRAITQAATTYGIARGINAIVSVLQSTEVSIGIASLSPGEFLDPLNDLIERFSWVTMMAIASLGIQKLLLTIASSLMFKILLTITGAIFFYSIIYSGGREQNAMMRLFVIALFLRFAVGSVVVANDLVEYFFLVDTKAQATSELAETTNALNEINFGIKSKKEDQGWWENITDTLSVVSGNQNEKIKEQTEKVSNNVIDLIVVYVAQAIIFPIIFLWAFYKMTLWVWMFNWAGLLYISKGVDAKRPLETLPVNYDE